MSQQRPAGVPLLASLELLGGVGSVAAGAYYLSEVNGFVTQFGYGLGDVPDFTAFFSVEIVFGVVALLVAYALWTGKGWGWSLGVYGSLASLVYSIGFGAYFVATYGDYTETAASGLSLIVALIVVFYLDRPQVKAYFGKEQAGLAPPPPQ